MVVLKENFVIPLLESHGFGHQTTNTFQDRSFSFCIKFRVYKFLVRLPGCSNDRGKVVASVEFLVGGPQTILRVFCAGDGLLPSSHGFWGQGIVILLSLE